MNTGDQALLKYLSNAKQITRELKETLPNKIYAASLSVKSKIPFKAVSLREALIHRVADLSEVTCELFDQTGVRGVRGSNLYL